MKNKRGVTLTALIITIIVMIILAGVTISIVVGDNGVLNQTEAAGEKQIYAIAEEKIKAQCEYITKGKNIGKVDLLKTESNIRNLNLEEIKEIDSTLNLLTISLKNDNIIEISGANGNLELNEYGFYYNVDYVCYDYFGYNRPTDKFSVKILEDGTYIANVYQDYGFENWDYVSLKDFTGTKILEIDSIEINKEYTAIGALESECKWIIDENGDIKSNIKINKEKITYSNKNINLGGLLNCVASEDGKSFNVNGKTFSIEE